MAIKPEFVDMYSPDCPLTFNNDNRHGGINSKEKSTAMLASNMDGFQKFYPLMIGYVLFDLPRSSLIVKICSLSCI